MPILKRHFISIPLLVLLCFICSCSGKHHDVVRSVYYWKTSYAPTQFELNTLGQHNVRIIYLRLFDVDIDENTGHIMPVAPVRIQAIDSGFEYMPVVFITQQALASIQDSGLEQVVRNICGLAGEICTRAGISPAELQIDCDWTRDTRLKYFALLMALKKQPFMKGKTLSCTIRMNQVKYQTYNGIPPADKGLVMVYGMGNLKKPGAHNSILDIGEAEDYLQFLDRYPLKLDIAFPLFEWCVLFRNRQYRGILRDVRVQDVNSGSLFKLKEPTLYTCFQDTTWHGFKLKAGDELRMESPSYDDILSIADFASRKIINKEVNVILFACDSQTFNKFTPHEFEKIYNSLN